jgi:pyruvate,water dikinase
VNDLLEHYPDAPTPLDHAAVVEGYEQLQHAMRDLGLSVRSARELMAMDADGVTRIAPQLPVPQLRFLGFPWHIWKAMHSDPAAWRPFGIAAQERQRRLATADLAGLSDADVADQLRRAQDLANDIARVRFAQIILPLFVRGWALQLYGRLAGRKMQPYEWLAGLPYKTVEVEADLQRLADVLLSDSILAEIVRITPPEKRRTALAGNPAGTAFLALLDDFLNRHGARTMQLYLPYSHRSWREEPEALWATLQAVVRSGEVNAAMHRQRTGEQRYSKLNQELLARLPRFLHGSYRRLTEGYRADHQSREETVYHIEQAFEQARRAMDEAAARLVQRGVLRHSSEVLFLTLDDLLGVLRGTLEGSEATKRAARRRVKQETARTVWRGQKSWPKAISGDALVGVAGSPGSARGPVRKIMKVEDFARLKRGDVLVCPFTDPAWTPLFSLASAVVADTGGPLSHAAIVAREYGIPAVLGTQIGTQRLADDDRVQVDGAEGRVVRLKPAAE